MQQSLRVCTLVVLLELTYWPSNDRKALVLLVLSPQYDEGEMYQQFKVFYDDVLPEFKKAGKVVQFKVG